MTDHHPNAADVAGMLAVRIRPLCEQLLAAGKAKGNYWTCGGVDNAPGGSMWVHLSGPKAGKWQDAATGEFGDALDLVAACTSRGDKKAAYRWACAWLGLVAGKPVAPEQRPVARARVDGEDEQAERRRRWALRLYLESQPVLAGTPVAAYLAHRGIDLGQLGRQPRALRYHPSVLHAPSRRRLPAMIAAISSIDVPHIATHRTWLEQDQRGRWIKARVEDPKMSIGNFVGGSIRIWRGSSNKALRDAPGDETIVIGEGIETCLSIALACPEYRILAAVSLGNMGSIALPPQTSSIILAADNDTKPAARLAFQRVVERHLDAGRTVRVARAAIGKDFNDTLCAWGVAA